jgi:N-acetylneuraminic acid mutarotase
MKFNKLIIYQISILVLLNIRPVLTNQWQVTGSLNRARICHSAIKLKNGKILVTGGYESFDNNSNYNSSCEIYDPDTGKWQQVASMNYKRYCHDSVLLPNSKVLVIGGGSQSCEIYDPDNNIWTLTDSLILNPQNVRQDAIRCSNNTVLLVSNHGSFYIGQLYDISTCKWSLTDTLTNIGFGFRLINLKDKVLATGGILGDYGCEIYNPLDNSWHITEPMVESRGNHIIQNLQNDFILVAGGENYRGTSMHPYSSCEVLNTNTMKWQYVSPMNLARIGHASVLLKNYNVLVVGGFYELGLYPRTETEVYNYNLNQWNNVGKIKYPRSGFSLTLLNNGNVLLAGGCDSTECELFIPNQTYVKNNLTVFGSNNIELFQNHPNPFNGSTRIKYLINTPSNVKINLYNIKGQIIKCIVDKHHKQGEYNIDINSDNLTSGVYIYKLITNSQSTANTMLILK